MAHETPGNNTYTLKGPYLNVESKAIRNERLKCLCEAQGASNDLNVRKRVIRYEAK